MAADNDVDIRIRLRNAKQFQTDATRSSSAVKGIGSSAATAGKSASTAAGSTGRLSKGFRALGGAAKLASPFVGAYTAALAGKTVISEWREAVKTNRDTAAVIKSTGGAANVSAPQVAKLSQQLSSLAGIDDEEIQSAANKLLTFSTIANKPGKGNDIFNQTLRTAVDLGARFDKGLTPSVTMLGKALADPEKGLSKLSRTGVNFTAKEEKKIKALQASGDLLGAQKVMLRAVDKQVKGAAAAKADPFDKLNVSMKNLAETIGFAVGPTLAKWANSLAKFVTQMESGTGAGGRFVDKLKSIYQWASRNWGAIKRVGIAVAALAVTFKTIKIARSVASEVGGAVRAVRGMPGRIDKALSRVRSVMRRILGGAGKSAGTNAASNAATSMASDIGPKMDKKQGRFNAAGGKAGRGFGKAMGKGAVVGLVIALPALGFELKKFAEKQIDKIKNDSLRRIASALTVEGAVGEIKGLFGIGGAGQAGRPGTGGPDLRPRTSSPGPMVRPTPREKVRPIGPALALGGPSEAVIHMPIYLDGRKVGESVRRHALNDQARQ